MITIDIVNSQEWLTDVENYATSVFQHPQWLNCVSTENLTPIYLHINNQYGTIAKFAGIKVFTPSIGQYYLYSYSGLAVLNARLSDEPTIRECYKQLLGFAKKNGLYKMLIASYGNTYSFDNFPNGFFKFERKEFPISPNNHQPTEHYHTQIKRHLKKAQKSNASIAEWSTNDSNKLDRLFYLLDQTHAARIIKHQKEYNPFYLKFLNNNTLAKLLQCGIAKLYSATIDNGPEHCMEFNIEAFGQSYMMLKASDEIGYQNSLSSVLSDYAIEKYKAANIRLYNLGGEVKGKAGEGLSTYKIRLGADERIVHGATTNYLTYPLRLLNPFIFIARQLPRESSLIVKLKQLVWE